MLIRKRLQGPWIDFACSVFNSCEISQFRKSTLGEYVEVNDVKRPYTLTWTRLNQHFCLCQKLPQAVHEMIAQVNKKCHGQQF